MEDLKNISESADSKSNTKQRRRAPYKKNYHKDVAKKENILVDTKGKSKKTKKETDLEVKFKKSPIKIIPLGGLL